MITELLICAAMTGPYQTTGPPHQMMNLLVTESTVQLAEVSGFPQPLTYSAILPDGSLVKNGAVWMVADIVTKEGSYLNFYPMDEYDRNAVTYKDRLFIRANGAWVTEEECNAVHSKPDTGE